MSIAVDFPKAPEPTPAGTVTDQYLRKAAQTMLATLLAQEQPVDQQKLLAAMSARLSEKMRDA